MVGKMVATRVDVDGGRKGFDVYGLRNPSFHPVLFVAENGDILSAEVVVMVARVLQHS